MSDDDDSLFGSDQDTDDDAPAGPGGMPPGGFPPAPGRETMPRVLTPLPAALAMTDPAPLTFGASADQAGVADPTLNPSGLAGLPLDLSEANGPSSPEFQVAGKSMVDPCGVRTPVNKGDKPIHPIIKVGRASYR